MFRPSPTSILSFLAAVSLSATASAAHTSSPLAAPLAPYDAVRAALAGDDLGAATRQAAKLQVAAKTAAQGAQHPAKHALHALAAAAGQIAQASDIAAARAAFGDASRALLGLLAADPAVAQGVTAYRCPMTKTYKKWVQLSGPMANPYMGKRMLHCGSKVPVQP